MYRIVSDQYRMVTSLWWAVCKVVEGDPQIWGVAELPMFSVLLGNLTDGAFQ
jgi:hypothetical protein